MRAEPTQSKIAHLSICMYIGKKGAQYHKYRGHHIVIFGPMKNYKIMKIARAFFFMRLPLRYVRFL